MSVCSTSAAVVMRQSGTPRLSDRRRLKTAPERSTTSTPEDVVEAPPSIPFTPHPPLWAKWPSPPHGNLAAARQVEIPKSWYGRIETADSSVSRSLGLRQVEYSNWSTAMGTELGGPSLRATVLSSLPAIEEIRMYLFMSYRLLGIPGCEITSYGAEARAGRTSAAGLWRIVGEAGQGVTGGGWDEEDRRRLREFVVGARHGAGVRERGRSAGDVHDD